MLMLITGRSGSGKSTILKQLNYVNTLYLDDYVKKEFYIAGNDVYDEIIKEFGLEVSDGAKIITSVLGKIVFHDKKKLKKLNKIVFPKVKEYLNSFKKLKQVVLVEMATYINYEKEFKGWFDKIVLIKRRVENINDKFNYMTTKFNPIRDKDIKCDYIIQNETINQSVRELKKIIEDNMTFQ